MSSTIVLKLIAIFAVVAIGWGAGRTRPFRGEEPARVLSNLAFLVFAPALLFRTTARIDLAALPWRIIVAFFGPVVALLLVVYAVSRWRRRRRASEAGEAADAAGPSVRAISTSFGNTVQLGIPIVTALFGEAGLALHVAIVSLHAVTLLTILTILVELDLARAAAATGEARPGVAATVVRTARRTVLHPIVLPVLVGLGWNLAGLPVPGPLDDVLVILGQAVIPVCLVLIGMSLAHYGIAGSAREALVLSAGKLFVQPAAVLAAAYWGAGLHGTTLAVVVLCAALPIGSNALLFAQRYDSLVAEATAGIVISTLVFAATGPAWLLLLAHLPP